jgi:hypothetical protein
VKFFQKEKKKQSKKEKKIHLKAGRGENARLSRNLPIFEGNQPIFVPGHLPGLAFYQQVGMCGDRLNWFSFLVFGENIST